MKKSWKIVLIVLGCIVVLQFAVCLVISEQLVKYSLQPERGVRNKDLSGEKAWMDTIFRTTAWFPKTVFSVMISGCMSPIQTRRSRLTPSQR